MICSRTTGLLASAPTSPPPLSNLKVVAGHEGEGGGGGGLLGTPALMEEGVSDEDSLLQAGVQVKRDVAAVGVTQVHAEPGKGSRGSEAPPPPVWGRGL